MKKSFVNCKKALESCESHSNLKYHKFAMEQAHEFTRFTEGKSFDVTELLRTDNNKIATQNRQTLSAIIETTVLCGRQELAFRGSSDSGEIGLEEPLNNFCDFELDPVIKSYKIT